MSATYPFTLISCTPTNSILVRLYTLTVWKDISFDNYDYYKIYSSHFKVNTNTLIGMCTFMRYEEFSC